MEEQLVFKLPILVTQPGAEATIREKGLKIEAVVDSAIVQSALPKSVVETLYSGSSIPYGSHEFLDAVGDLKHVMTSFVTLGVETVNGGLVHSQIECWITKEDSAPLVGSDFLTQLGLRVTFDYKDRQVLVESYNWMSFEEEVASIYRSLGATVKQNVNLAGLQIDALVEETTPSKQRFRLAVECKFYKERIGNRLVNEFSRVIDTLKREDLADKGVIVSSIGFTQDARLVAETTGIELTTIDDLRQILSTHGIQAPIVQAPKIEKLSSKPKPSKKNPKIFVVMPFAPELDDVYHLGIREVVAKLGGSCERADELQYVGGIIEKVYDSIRSADIIVAELTTPNPNVYYEVGFAHALGVPVILLTRNIGATPFDLRSYNHVVYSSIVDLRLRLGQMLAQVAQLEH